MYVYIFTKNIHIKIQIKKILNKRININTHKNKLLFFWFCISKSFLLLNLSVCSPNSIVSVDSMPQVWNVDIMYHCQTYLHLCCIAWPNHLLLPLHQAWNIKVTVWRQWTKEDSICVLWYAFVWMSVCEWHTSKHNLSHYASIRSQDFGHVHTPHS